MYDMKYVQSSPEWLLNRVSQWDSQEVAVVSVLCGIWHGPNKLVWESKTIAPSIVMDLSYFSIFEWQQTQDNSKTRGRDLEDRVSSETVK